MARSVLVGLEGVSSRPQARILVVHREKTADRARELLRGNVVVTYPGGLFAWANSDWTPLAGRMVTIWMPADGLGLVVTADLANHLAGIGCEVNWVDTTGMNDGWVLDDENWTTPELLTWIKPRIQPFLGTPKRGPEIIQTLPEPPQDAPESPPDDAPPEPVPDTHPAPARPKSRLRLIEGNTVREVEQDLPALDLVVNSKGLPHCNEENARRMIIAAPQYATLHYDTFRRERRIDDRPLADDDTNRILAWLQSSGLPTLKIGQCRTAVALVAAARERDSLLEFWQGLPAWDGTERIANAFVDAWGAQDCPLMRAASQNFFRAMAARAMKAGCKVDNIWIFEGPQGTLKSSSLSELAGEFYSETSTPVGTADFVREIRSLNVVELAELTAMLRRDAETLKQVLTRREDRLVEKWMVEPQRFPRRCVFTGTTNEAEYWSDPTGARRLIPIFCGEIRLDLIRSNRMQWFAEARAHVELGEPWWIYPEADADEARMLRQQSDPWMTPIAEWIATAVEITAPAALAHIEPDVSKRDGRGLKRVMNCFRALGLVPPAHAVSRDGVRVRVWRRR